MNAYYCGVALRITHPKWSADEICLSIGLEAYRKWTVGEPKKTIKGKLLKGLNQSTLCVFHLMPSTEKVELESFIDESLANLIPYKEFLETLCATGGEVEFYISLFCNGNIGAIFEWRLLSKLAERKISLLFDIIPTPDNFTLEQLPKWYFKVSEFELNRRANEGASNANDEK